MKQNPDFVGSKLISTPVVSRSWWDGRDDHTERPNSKIWELRVHFKSSTFDWDLLSQNNPPYRLFFWFLKQQITRGPLGFSLRNTAIETARPPAAEGANLKQSLSRSPSVDFWVMWKMLLWDLNWQSCWLKSKLSKFMMNERKPLRWGKFQKWWCVSYSGDIPDKVHYEFGYQNLVGVVSLAKKWWLLVIYA